MFGNTYTALKTSGAKDAPSTASRQTRKLAAQIMWFSVALVITITFAFPLYFMVSSSFKAEKEVLASPVHIIPENFQGLAHYQKAFDTVPLGRYFFNSFLTATIDVTVTVFFSALAGFGFAKYNFWGKQFFFVFILATMTIPFQVLLVPLFIEVRSFGWDNTYAGCHLGTILAWRILPIRDVRWLWLTVREPA